MGILLFHKYSNIRFAQSYSLISLIQPPVQESPITTSSVNIVSLADGQQTKYACTIIAGKTDIASGSGL